MSAIVRRFTNTLLPKEPEYDVESHVTRTERCFFPNYICRDIFLYPATCAIIVAVPIAAWGYYSKDYLLASIVTFLAVTILVLAVNTWIMKPWANMGRKIDVLNDENRAAKEMIRASGLSAQHLLEAGGALKQESKVQLDAYAELMKNHQASVSELLKIKQEYVLTIERCERLESEMAEMKRILQIAAQDIKVLGTVKEELVASVSKAKKERVQLDSSVNRLDDAVVHFDLENKEFDGENAEMNSYLNVLRKEVEKLKTNADLAIKEKTELKFLVSQLTGVDEGAHLLQDTAAHMSAATSALESAEDGIERVEAARADAKAKAKAMADADVKAKERDKVKGK